MKKQIKEEIDLWEQKWCSDSEGMNPKMRKELDNIIEEGRKQEREEELEFLKELRVDIQNKLDNPLDMDAFRLLIKLQKKLDKRISKIEQEMKG